MPVIQKITTTVSGVTLTTASYANPVTVTSAGTVAGGIYASQNWTVANYGSISGTTGILLKAGGSVVNKGTIASQTGVYLAAAGAITNAGTGALIEGATGVLTGSSGAVTVTNFGTIDGTSGTAVGSNRRWTYLVVEAGSRLIGVAVGDGGTLDFGSAGGAGTIAGLGNGVSYSGFGVYRVDAGANWTLAGSNTVGGGTVFNNAGRLTVTGSLVNGGSIGGGVTLSADGQFSNQTNATVSATGTALYGAAGIDGSVTNQGVILGQDDGVQLLGSGGVINAAGALISGGTGVDASMLDNAGTVTGTDFGVFSPVAGGQAAAFTIVNRTGALISGLFDGVQGSGTIFNAGTITSQDGEGVYLTDVTGPGFVSNSALGLIQGYDGIKIEGTVDNAGTILATQQSGEAPGVGLLSNGSVVNRSGGVIQGQRGVWGYGSGQRTVTNYGTIIGNSGTAVLLTSVNDVLVVEAGSTLVGSAVGAGSTLAFGAGGGAGTESGIGSTTLTGSAPGTFAGFSTYQVQAGANWTFAGANTIGSGKTLADAGTLTIAGSLAATGRLTVTGSLVNGGSIGGGVTLSAGGQFTNETNATVSATGTALYGAAGIDGSVTNQGVILGQDDGVQLLGSGGVINAAGALISGGTGVDASMLDNAGTVTGTDFGVFSPVAGGQAAAFTIVNRTGALISGLFDGVQGSGTIFNAGTITSQDGEGVYLTDVTGPGFVSNSALGLIQGYDGIKIEGTVDNAGTILATQQSGEAPGVGLLSNGSVVNRSGGVIQGQRGVWGYGSGQRTVTNYGTIIGNSGTAVLLTSVNDVLVVEAGSTLVGSAVGVGGTLAFGAGGGAGTISGLGNAALYQGFGHYQVTAGADWTFSGTNTIASGDTLSVAGTLIDTGTVSIATGASLTAGGPITVDGGVVIDQTSLGGTNPAIDITGNGTVALLGTPPAGAAVVDFTGAGLLSLANVNGVTIKDFAAGDAIGVTAAAYQAGASATYSPSSHALTLTSGASQFVLQMQNFTLAPGDYLGVVNNGGHAQIEEIPCFLRGTRIKTQRGEVAVEDLAAGDTVLTLAGEVRPIIWIGSGRTRVRRGQRGAATPIRVRKGALGDNVPHRDLRITKGHALFVDGVLIPAEFLVNHRSILWDDVAQTVEYYHIELAAHDVLLAEGAAAESYRDDGNRRLFANANSGCDQPPKPPCAPVLTGGPIVDAAVAAAARSRRAAA